ncbi:MAG: hypothetical protein ACR2JF_18055, partial [Iamia sp.]
FDRLGLAPPGPVAAAHDRLTSVVAAYEARPVPGSDDLAVATIKALEAGADPAADDEVQRITTAMALAANHGAPAQLAGVLVDQLRTACASHADDIVDVWRPPFEKAAADLVAAYGILGAIPLDATDVVVRKGSAATDAWSDATSAVATIGVVVDGWKALYALLTGSTAGRRHALLIAADVDLNVWVDGSLDGTSSDPWAAVLAGHRLDLATIAGHRQRVAAVDSAREERRVQAEQRRPRPHRQMPPAAA